MFMKLSDRIVNHLIKLEKIDKEDKEIYTFGLETLFMNLFNMTSAILIGIAMGQLVECLVFLVLFLPLRSYVGGYHAGSLLRCFFLSNFVMILVLLLFRVSPAVMESGMGLFFLLAASGLIALSAPIENPQKPLDAKEMVVYRFRARMILAVFVLLGCLCYAAAYFQGVWMITLTVFVMLITEILGALQNTYCHSNEHHISDE